MDVHTLSSTIDLRSDTVTMPSDAMRNAIAAAEVGDDVLDGDPTTRRLEERVADLLGHESALFFPTGTQANQVAIGLQCEPGTEVIVDSNAHLVHYEQAGAAAIWGVQLRIVQSDDGIVTPAMLDLVAWDGTADYPRTSAVVIENSHSWAGGRITGLAQMQAIRNWADARGIPIHLDGARLWNVAAAQDASLSQLAQSATTVMVSFSKGLGCPVGACLAGPSDLLRRGVDLRRRLGGGMRQSGVLTAACLYALDHNVHRLVDDHANANALAELLAGHPEVEPVKPDTNIVMLKLRSLSAHDGTRLLAKSGVLVSIFGPRRLRVVTHLGVTEPEVLRAADVIAHVLGEEV